jgi:hypothetical protein
MTTELPERLQVHIDQAFAGYLAVYKAGYSLDTPDDFIKLNSRIETAERELIQTLASIWEEWTHRSPRSRTQDKQYPYGWTYPFANWVGSLFPWYTDNVRPTPPARIRRILQRSTAVEKHPTAVKVCTKQPK